MPVLSFIGESILLWPSCSGDRDGPSALRGSVRAALGGMFSLVGEESAELRLRDSGRVELDSATQSRSRWNSSLPRRFFSAEWNKCGAGFVTSRASACTDPDGPVSARTSRARGLLGQITGKPRTRGSPKLPARESSPLLPREASQMRGIHLAALYMPFEGFYCPAGRQHNSQKHVHASILRSFWLCWRPRGVNAPFRHGGGEVQNSNDDTLRFETALGTL